MSGTDAHLPTHVLADLAEGLLDDAQSREVQAHVDSCLTCQATLDELAGVTVALRALPAEVPVPEFVAARISHALAAERASGPGAEAATPADAEGGTVAWFRRRLPQGLAAAASVAVLGLAGYVAVGNGGGGGDDAGSGTVAADAQAEADDAAPEFSTSPDGSRMLTQEPSYGTTPSDPPSAADTTATPPPIDPARLTAGVEDVVDGTAESAGPEDSCGVPLSEEVGLPVVGTTMVGAGVLVVLDDATTYDGWLINTCGSTTNESMAPQVEVPKSE